jgi:hypothetical protein
VALSLDLRWQSLAASTIRARGPMCIEACTLTDSPSTCPIRWGHRPAPSRTLAATASVQCSVLVTVLAQKTSAMIGQLPACTPQRMSLCGG